jgi:hypothetical protein
MRSNRMIATARNLVLAALFCGGLPASALAKGGMGGMHIGGLGGLHIGGFGGMHMGGMHGGGMHMGGMHSGGFHGGSFHSGGYHSGGFNSGAYNSGAMRSGGFQSGNFQSGAASMGRTGTGSMGLGSSGAAGSSFAARHSGAALGSAGRASMTAAGNSNQSTRGGTFLARHSVAAMNVNPTSQAKASAIGNGMGNAASGGNQQGQNPYGLGPVSGVLIPRHGGIVGFPWVNGIYPWSSTPYYGYGYGGYGYGGYGYGYGGYGYGYGGSPYSYCGYYGLPMGGNTIPLAPTVGSTPSANGAAVDFAALGDTEFRTGNYAGAVTDWRHALLDDPNNPVLIMLLGQSLFATGRYDEAAGAVQHAMRLLGPEQWGVVVGNYAELYRGNQDYTDQLRALEAAGRKTETASPAVRFLLGYHYAYLGYPKQAVAELDKALATVPNDEVTKKLREVMAAKLPPELIFLPKPTSTQTLPPSTKAN